MGRGFWGKILRVNLTNGDIVVQEPGEGFYRRYWGGWGIIAYYLLKEIAPGVDPLGPENLLIFAAGPLTGAPFVGNDRYAVGAKSPLTGRFGAGETGGHWGTELKRAGFDAVVMEGCSAEPVYLWVKDGRAELRSAAHVWGQGTKATAEAISAELQEPKARIAGIGAAGENLVRYACIMSGLKDAVGRCGLGAVMGSKKLKAVAVTGTGSPPLADAGRVREMNRALVASKPSRHVSYYEYGTAGGIPGLNADGGLPTHNFQRGQFHGYENLSGQTVADTILTDREGCYACPIRCKRVVQTTGKYANDPAYGGPEYETTAGFGSLCEVGDLSAVALAHQLCNDYSLDTISASMCIAFAMECREKGIITAKDTDGVDLRFGNADAMLEMIGRIARREGYGDLLAEGVARASARIGGGSEDLALHVNGQELPLHEPRYKQGLGVGYCASPTGAEHIHNLHDTGLRTVSTDLEHLRSFGPLEPMALNDLTPDKMRALKYKMNWRATKNCLLTCIFPVWSPNQLTELARAVTGWDVGMCELAMLGERCLTMARAFNVREGFTAAADMLPGRFFTPFAEGPLEGAAIDREQFERAIATYYGMMGWDQETGVPSEVVLQELAVGWVADEIAGREGDG